MPGAGRLRASACVVVLFAVSLLVAGTASADGLRPHLVGPDLTRAASPGAPSTPSSPTRARRHAAPRPPAAAGRRSTTPRRLSGLGDAAAVSAARRAFPEVLHARPLRALRLPLGQRVTRYLGDRGAVVRGAGGRARSLVESTLPLRADGIRGLAPTSLELDAFPGGVRPRNPLVPVTIGAGRDPSLRFTAFGVSVDGARSADAQVIDDARVVWPNALTDTDVIVAPNAIGASVDAILRSASSPDHLDLTLTGDDVSVVPATGGGAVALVTHDGVRTGRVLSPAAFDAAGRPVPVRAEVLTGNRLRLAVDHRTADPEYPVFVDPVVEGAVVDDDLTPAAGGWTFSTSTPGSFSGSVGTGAFGPGQYQTSQAPATYADGALSRWRYQAPGTAFVYRVDFDAVSFTPATGAGGGSCLTEGIDTGSGWETSGTGPWSTCAAASADSRSLCARAACAQDGTPGSAATVEQAMDGAGARTSASTAFAGGATVYLSDGDAPTLSSSPAPTSWHRTGLVTWDAQAHDSGLGVASISWEAPASQDGESPVGCTGLADDRCPASYTGGVSLDADTLPEGINTITLKAHDAVGRDSAPYETSVKVDHTGPEVGLSGSLASLDGRTIAVDAGLQVGASDGSSGDPRSGVASIDVLVDGVVKDHVTQPCPSGSCPLSRGWTLVPSQYSVGTHAVRVEATDVAGNTTVKTLSVNVGSGRITSLAEGERTARRLMLAAEGYTNQTSVTFQYRTDPANSWADVPLTTVRKTDGAAVSAWPLALDDHKSPLLAWDLVGSATQAGMISSSLLTDDSAIQVRAVFSGGSGGVSQEVSTTLDRDGVSARDATAPIGPGEVDLVTGNFTMAQTDVSIDAFNSDLTIQRVFNSRGGNGGGIPLGEHWSLSVPMATADAPFRSLVNYAQVADPWTGETAPYVVLFGSFGEEVVFSETASGYAPDAGYEEYRLTRVMSSTNPTVVSRFELRNTQTGERSTFTGGGGAYRLTEVEVGGQDNSLSYLYDGSALAAIVAPHPGSTCTLSSFGRGCKGLFLNYDVSWPGRPVSIDYTAWDPATSAMKTTTRVQYEYVSNGPNVLLRSVRYPERTGSTYDAQYRYDDTTGALTDIWPANEDGWAFNWESGKLKTVGRSRNFGPWSRWNVRYDIPRAGTGAPYAMGASDVAAWGQEVVPLDATALFRADDEPADPVASYAKATIHYLDGYGRVADVARPGGRIETTERDRSGNVLRTLTAANRARALAAGSTAQDHADKAATIDTRRTYDQDGLRLLEELGPEHEVALPDGSHVRARRHVVSSYDQGAPSTGGPYNLLTRQTVGARVAGQSSDQDVRMTEYQYDWALRKQTKQITDPSGLALATTTLYDSALGVPVEARQPRSPSGGDAAATRSIYYSAGTNAEDSACSSRPEWAGLLCREKPVAQPGTTGLPDLPTTTYKYSYLGQLLERTEQVGGDTKVRTLERDGQSRVTSDETTGTSGSSVPKVLYEYAGQATQKRTLAEYYDGSVRYRFSSVLNFWGQSYYYENYRSDGGGYTATGRTYQFDENGRIKSIDNRTVYDYDAVTGDLTSISPNVPWNGLNFGTVTATYDPDGNVKTQTFDRGGITRTTTRDETGTPVGLTYVKTSGCSANCTWLDQEEVLDIHGQRVERAGDRSSQDLTYDAAGRLQRAEDDVVGKGCTTRTYGLDADSNRTSLTTHPPASNGDCSTSTTAATTAHSYDAADRLKDAGVDYDPFGRITDLPATLAGGEPLAMQYYTNDLARSYEQGGRTTTIQQLDPLLRPLRRQTTGRNLEVLSYGDDSDQPYQAASSNENGSTTETYIKGIDGKLDVDFVNDNGDHPMLQLRDLHDDVVGEAPLESSTTEPSARWETDEYGVPRELPKPIEAIGATSAFSVPFSTGVTLDKPSGVQEGDLLVAVLSAPPGQFIDKPSGWTHIGGGGNGSGYIAYYHVAGTSEPSSYAFAGASPLLRGGLVALRNVDQANPISAYAFTSGNSADATLPGITPAVADAALVQVVGADAGDTDGGASWTFSSSLAKQWDFTTGTSWTDDRTLAAGVRVLVNQRKIPVASSTATNALGNSGAVAWAGITIAVAPDPKPGQQRHRYLGGLGRPTELPTGIVGMGARVYVPQIGRFLQTDPVPGGSANDYDYGNQDPLNQIDPSGEVPNVKDVIVGMAKCGQKFKAMIRFRNWWWARVNAARERAWARGDTIGQLWSNAWVFNVIRQSQAYSEAYDTCGSIGKKLMVESAAFATAR
jgi:RHS repeat-associated protein